MTIFAYLQHENAVYSVISTMPIEEIQLARVAVLL